MQRSVATILLSALFVTAERCPSGWFTSPNSQNLCFNFVISRANFFLASDTCHRMNMNASLATISNVFENAALRAFALNFDEKPLAWIGLNDVAENGKWSWINTNYSTFTKWAPGSPSNNKKVEFWITVDSRYPKTEPNSLCVAMNSQTGYWVNKDCATRLPFFCSVEFTNNIIDTTAIPTTLLKVRARTI